MASTAPRRRPSPPRTPARTSEVGHPHASVLASEGVRLRRVTLARHATALVADGLAPAEAADRAIEELEATTASSAGLIVLDPEGRTGEAFNTELMQTAVAGE